jgi:hypothetical protein
MAWLVVQQALWMLCVDVFHEHRYRLKNVHVHSSSQNLILGLYV